MTESSIFIHATEEKGSVKNASLVGGVNTNLLTVLTSDGDNREIDWENEL